MIVLVGFMGAGKTTVGCALATRLGLPFVDSDLSIEARTGMSVPQMFEQHGEAAFRDLERDVIAQILTGDDAVVAVGGGALSDPATCAALEWTKVVFLDVSFAEAMRRLGDDRSRPMLSRHDPKALFEQRRGIYERVAQHKVDTTGRTVQEVLEEVAEALGVAGEVNGIRRVPVNLPGRAYDVIVGNDILGRLDELSPPHPAADMAFVVCHASLSEYAAPASEAMARTGIAVHRVELPEGETTKSLDTVEMLYRRFAEAGAHRRDVVVALGGGVITDVAGFAAATYHRGMSLVNVPTTLLGQIDAAIGGKTGVNTSFGKNLVGAIYQPVSVVCDVAALRSLPREEMVAGTAEMAKYGFIADPSLLDLLERRGADIIGVQPDALIDAVARCAAIKAEVVSADEREQGRRAVLNYGHTFGHAIEQALGLSIRHGEAVSLGMMAAAYLAHEMGLLGEEAVDRHRRVLSGLGLPTSGSFDAEILERAWVHDKKYSKGVRFVLLSAIGRPETGIDAPKDALERALKRLAG